MNLRWRLRRIRNMGRGASTHPFAVAGPSAQQTVDIFKDQWITAFPDELGVDAGWVNHFDPEVDARVPWLADQSWSWAPLRPTRPGCWSSAVRR